MSKRYAQRGITLFEVLVAISIAGLMAVITIPKISTPLAERQGVIKDRVDTLGLHMAGTVYRSATNEARLPGVTLPDDSYENCFRDYGSFLTIKNITGSFNYALLGDGSRVIFDANGLDEYGLASAETNKLARAAGGAVPAGHGRCGDYANAECFFLDINGEKGPNTIGKRGDIIPFRMDPSDGSVKTLFKWEKDAGYNLCRFESSYDYFAEDSTGCS